MSHDPNDPTSALASRPPEERTFYQFKFDGVPGSTYSHYANSDQEALAMTGKFLEIPEPHTREALEAAGVHYVKPEDAGTAL